MYYSNLMHILYTGPAALAPFPLTTTEVCLNKALNPNRFSVQTVMTPEMKCL